MKSGVITFVATHDSVSDRPVLDTETGNVYTDFDVDPELIASEMATLIEPVLNSGVPSDRVPYAESLENHYRGSEFQVSFADLNSWPCLILPLGVRGGTRTRLGMCGS